MEEGKENEITCKTLLGNQADMFSGSAWRVLYVKFMFQASSQPQSEVSPGLVQVLINNAMKSNIEGVNSFRAFVSILPINRKMNVPRPNLWKEDEQRNQSLITIQNVPTGVPGQINKIYYLIHTCFEFKQPIFGFKAQSMSACPIKYNKEESDDESPPVSPYEMPEAT